MGQQFEPRRKNAIGVRARSQRGFVLVWTSIFLLMLLGFCGFAVDLGSWYLKIQRAQRAADAAALDGAVWLPSQPDQAISVARAALIRNGVAQEFVDSAVIRPSVTNPNDLFVSVGTSADNHFLKFFGYSKSTKFQRASTGTWLPELGLGNLANVLGTEPADSSRPNSDLWEPAASRSQQGEYWIKQDGGQTYKGFGDRFNAGRCVHSDPTVHISIYGCSGNTSTEQLIDGTKTGGYEYMVAAPAGNAGSTLRIQIYDPAYVDVGPACEDSDASTLYSINRIPRWATGATPFCAGDTGRGPVNTYVKLLDATTKAPVATCPAERVFRGYGDIKRENPDGSVSTATPWNVAGDANRAEFRAVFHEWVTLCEIPHNAVNGDQYIVRVQSDLNANSQNKYSLRAALFNGSTLLSSAVQAQVRVYAKERLALSTNVEGANQRFALTWVPPGYAGSTITIDMFDIGDADQAGTFSLASSSVTASGGSTTQNCEYDITGRGGSFVPMTNCSLSGVLNDNGFDGQLFRIKWRIPSDYTCDITGATPTRSCYLFVNVRYPSSVYVHDNTTWTLKSDHAPIRLRTHR